MPPLARSPEALVGVAAVRQPAGLRALLRAGLLAGLDRPGRGRGWPARRLAACWPRPARGAWRACAVTLLFVVMAEFYVGSGMARIDRRGAARRGRPRRGASSVPLFAAVGGFLDRRRCGGQRHADAHGDRARPRHRASTRAWIAAVQNSICTNLTMLSPIRVSMGCGDPGARRRRRRRSIVAPGRSRCHRPARPGSPPS